MSRCWVNWVATCSLRVRIEMIGKLGSTEAMVWRTCAMDRLACGLVKMTISWRKSEPRFPCEYSGLRFRQEEERPLGPSRLNVT